MNVLVDGQLSGPHYFVKLSHPHLGHIFSLGENHLNTGACFKAGKDVVETVVEASEMGVRVYLEMPLKYELKTTRKTCPEKPASGPREDVLNDLRTCLWAVRKKRPDRIHFVDPREEVGSLPFTEEEEAFIRKCKREKDEKKRDAMVFDRFVVPLQKLCKGVSPHTKALVQTQGSAAWMKAFSKAWETEICDAAATAEFVYKRGDVDENVQIFRDATDASIELECAGRMMLDAALLGDPDEVFLFYGGSTHSKNILKLLQSFDDKFEIDYQTIRSTAHGCIKLPDAETPERKERYYVHDD